MAPPDQSRIRIARGSSSREPDGNDDEEHTHAPPYLEREKPPPRDLSAANDNSVDDGDPRAARDLVDGRQAERRKSVDVVDLDEDQLADALKRPENARALARILVRAARRGLTSSDARVPAIGGGKR